MSSASDHWHYASDIHGAADQHHRHYDLEEAARQVHALERDLAHTQQELQDVLERIAALEGKQ